MSVKTGGQSYVFPAYASVTILAEDRAAVFSVDKNGEPERLLATTGPSNQLIFRTTDEELPAYVSVRDGEHWSMDIVVSNPFDQADPVPFEVAEQMKPAETLADKLKRMLGDMMLERYGRDSNEIDTLEEAMDFDIDGDGEVALSGFEVVDLVDEVPEQPTEEAHAPDPAPAEDSVEETAASGTESGANPPK